VSAEDLERAGLPADPEPISHRESADGAVYAGPQQWPDYERCLRAKPTRSEADAQFTWISQRRGFSESEIAAKLFELSERAQASGEKYVARTIRNVAAWSGD
jgi:hypothetical protein